MAFLQLIVVGQPEAARKKRPIAWWQPVDAHLGVVSHDKPVFEQPSLDC